MVTVELLGEAEEDLMEGARFYENREEGLGAYFIDPLSADIDSLQLYADIHEKHSSHHRLLAKRFPYSIYYQVEESKALVTAVLDNRKKTSEINKRLT